MYSWGALAGFIGLQARPSSARYSRGRSNHNPGFQTVFVALVRMNRAHTRENLGK